jgi:hypothetical protein
MYYTDLLRQCNKYGHSGSGRASGSSSGGGDAGTEYTFDMLMDDIKIGFVLLFLGEPSKNSFLSLHIS